jgi:hypothetical protein
MRQIEPALLNRLLRFEAVSGVEVVLRRELQQSTVARLRLEYSPDAEPDLPKFLFLKSSDAKETSAEVEFYSSVGSAIGSPPLIRCFAAEYLVDEGRSYILLEDLMDTHSQPEQECIPTLPEMRSAVRALAKAHAAWWDRPEIGNGVGKLFDREWLDGFVKALERDVDEFVRSAEGLLSAEDRRAYSLMLNAAERIWGRLTIAEGLTATHGDMHWWNFLYPNSGVVDEVRIFDWQLWHVDRGARDLAFLLALGGFAEPRPDLEASLLEEYYEGLSINGIRNYSLDQLTEDYRWSAIRNLNIPVIFRSQGKHDSTWQTALRRALESFNRLGCRELIA